MYNTDICEVLIANMAFMFKRSPSDIVVNILAYNIGDLCPIPVTELNMKSCSHMLVPKNTEKGGHVWLHAQTLKCGKRVLFSFQLCDIAQKGMLFGGPMLRCMTN